MRRPADVEEFLSRLTETEEHLTVPLAGDEYSRWDAPDEDARRDYREAFMADCAREADEEGAASVIIHTQMGAVLCIGQPVAEQDWEFLELEGDNRPPLGSLLEE